MMLTLVPCPGRAHATMLSAFPQWPVYSSRLRPGTCFSAGSLLDVGNIQISTVLVSTGEHPATSASAVLVVKDVGDLFASDNEQQVRIFVCRDTDKSTKTSSTLLRAIFLGACFGVVVNIHPKAST